MTHLEYVLIPVHPCVRLNFYRYVTIRLRCFEPWGSIGVPHTQKSWPPLKDPGKVKMKLRVKLERKMEMKMKLKMMKVKPKPPLRHFFRIHD